MVALAAFVTLTAAVIAVSSNVQPTQAATNTNLNFQARLQTASGGIVADGLYNVEFKLYSASSGGSALWTETYLNSNTQGVRVKNGYLTTNLGSVTAFPGTINWDQELWITMTVRGTGSCAFGACTPTDAEMNPRLKLTGVPYAFKAGQLAKFNSVTGFTSTLELAAPTGGNQTFQIANQGAAGTYTLLTTQAASTNFIQNQLASPQSANAYIRSGSATASDPTLQIQLGLSQTGDLLQFRNAAGTIISKVDSSGNLASGNFVDLAGTGPFLNFGASAAVLNTRSAGNVGLVTRGVSGQTGDLMQLQNNNGDNLAGFSAAGQLYLGRASGATGSMRLLNATNANTVTIQSGVTSASYTLTVPTALGSSGDCLKDTTGAGVLGFGSCGGGVTTVGPFSGTALTNGASIAGNTITLGVADGSTPGMVSTLAQTFSGLKTFNDGVSVSNGLTASGTSSINNNANFATNINTGTSNALVTIGGGSGTFSLQTSNIDISNTGAITGATGITSTNTVQGATVNATTNIQTNGVTRIDASGNLGSIGTINSVGNITTTGSLLLTGIVNAFAADLSGYKTSNTGAVDAGKWTKLATCTLATQYSECRSTALVVMTGDGSGTTVRADVNWRVKQQAAFGGDPLVQLKVSDVDSLLTSNFVSVITSNAGPTTAELWGMVPGSYQGWSISPAINASEKVVWLNTQGFVAAVSAGTQTAAVYADERLATLNASGAIVGVGVNAGTGLLQGTGGLTLTGTVSINNNTNSATSINTGTSNALVTIGGGSGTFSLQTSNIDISNTGAITNATGYNGSGGVTTTGTTSINNNNNSTTSINTGTSNTLVTIGGGSGTFSLQTSNIDISNTGAITGATGITSTNTVQGATVNATSGYQINGTNGLASLSCSGGQFLQNATVTGGIVTAGACAAASGGGVSIVGTFSPTSFADGASITGNTITLGVGDINNPGMVSTVAQTLNGVKTFNNGIVAPSIGTAGATDFELKTNNTTRLTVNSTTGNLTATGSLTAAGVSAGSGLLQGTGGMTVTGAVNVNTSGSSATNIGTGTSSGTITIGNSSARAAFGAQILGGSPMVFQGATDNSFTTTLAVTDPTANNTLTLPNYSGTVVASSNAGTSGQCLKSTGATTAAAYSACGSASTLQDAYDTSGGGANPHITLATGNSGLKIRDNATPVSGNLFQLQNSGGTVTYFGASTAGISIQNASAANALVFTSSDGHLKIYNPSNAAKFVDIYYDNATDEAVFSSSGTTRVGSGSGNITLALSNAADVLVGTKTLTLGGAYTANDFSFTRTITAGATSLGGSVVNIESLSSGSANASTILRINENNNSATGNLIVATKGGAGNDKFKVDTGGTVTIAAGQTYAGAGALTLASGSGTGLTISGNSASTFGTTAGALTLAGAAGINITGGSGNITIGTSDTTGTLLVLDTNTDAADPTGVNGGMYYNSNVSKFRCYEGGEWRNCVFPEAIVTKSSNQNATASSTTFQNVTDLAVPLATNSRYTFQATIPVDVSNITADARITFTVPAGATITASGVTPTTGTASTACNIVTSGQVCSIAVGTVFRSSVTINGFVSTGGTAGNLQFQIAQNTSTAAATPTVLQGGMIRYIKQ